MICIWPIDTLISEIYQNVNSIISTSLNGRDIKNLLFLEVE